jgi:putative salt-induced outer membrane protein YdiY
MQSSLRVIAGLLLVTTGGLLVNSAHADVLVLKNGDRITGEIKHIWDGEVSIEPEYSDEFDVDLEIVDHIESDREFDVELWDGREATVKLTSANDENQQIIEFGDETLAIALEDILELDEPTKDFDWESHIDFSANYNSGNTNTYSGQLRGDSTIETPNNRHRVDLSNFRETTGEGALKETTKDQTRLSYNYNWLFRDPWFLAANASHERDPILELDSRLIVSVGLGRDIFNTPRRFLSIQLGAGGQQEDAGGMSDNSTVATWALRYEQDVFSGDLEVFHNHSITHNIEGRTNTSYKTSTGLRYEITDLLYANLTLDYNYETDPVDAIGNEDATFLIGIGAEF